MFEAGELCRRPRQHGPRRHARADPPAWTPASWCSTTATTPTSSVCCASSAWPGNRSDMSFGVSDGRGDFEYNSASPNGLFAKRAHLLTPWFHRMIADLVRFNRARASCWRARSGDVSLGRVAGRAALLRSVRAAPDRPAGLGGVVRGPAPDVELSGTLPRRVLRQPRDARADGPTALAHRHGWL